MKVTVTLEVRFDQLPDGSVWTLSNFHHSFWDRYLKVFEQVEIVGRCRQVQTVSSQAKRVDRKDDIIFVPLPHYIGPYQYLVKRSRLKEALFQISQKADAVIMRVGSPIADMLYPMLLKSQHPYGLEVVGDPLDTFAPGANPSKLRPFFRWWFCRALRKETEAAAVVSYVTSVRLPERYPATNAHKVIYASSIELKESHLISAPRRYAEKKSFKLISVGALEDWRKGQDLALRCLKKLREDGLDVSLIWVGDGRMRPQTEELARELGLTPHIDMRGQLASGQAIFEALDEADIFLLPTRGEGLPRAMIEAMARGLPAVGSDVGGIPELIDKSLIHAVDDWEGMARILKEMMSSPQCLDAISQLNLIKSKNYLSDELGLRRTALYQKLKDMTHEWQKNNSSR